MSIQMPVLRSGSSGAEMSKNFSHIAVQLFFCNNTIRRAGFQSHGPKALLLDFLPWTKTNPFVHLKRSNEKKISKRK